MLYSKNGIVDYNLPDRIIKMFCHFAGFDSFEKAKKYFVQKILLADHKNREVSKHPFQLQQGDFVKGIRDIKYFAML